ncbi:type II toxin-antitoxin system PemK/MazF family toxin [Limosilactobacillus sp.]|jgi:mRNA interferase MazF|uniref:type II toxin-antitoxin system PemK/MazF family toxin n=1 Tax=Limosilactobacillus sp. TaxID=2773925 RepID=UPI0025BB4A2E|nr:type II toxin-antitoxin system PemK/MazF family toxin [Limosilactobacillus sp.]MCH3922016.1 type II toxin-antitoxin system PemK/MazF family toxin [Limosilactobacillus sp.]MCH3928787.1 type II toxin-antitoxin system PemK/MazF family toxin [Limosilactobacillus sp.]
MEKQIWRGDVYYADLSPVVGSEQGGVRPVVILQNDRGNRYSPTVIVAAITAQDQKHPLPTHVRLPKEETGLAHDSVVLVEQLRTIDKQRLQDRLTTLSAKRMRAVDHALAVSVGLTPLGPIDKKAQKL